MARRLSTSTISVHCFSVSGHHRCINVVAHNLLICNAVLAKALWITPVAVTFTFKCNNQLAAQGVDRGGALADPNWSPNPERSSIDYETGMEVGS
jgi:hypothetical protein